MTGTTTVELAGPLEAEFVAFADLRREPDGKLRITRLKEFSDSVKITKLGEAAMKKFPAGLPV